MADQLIASYAPDWLLTLLTAGFLQLINRVYGFRREFSLTDTSIQHTYAVHERVSVGLLAVIAFIVPLILMAIVSLGISRSVWDFHAGLLGLVVAHAFALTATTIIKVSVGRPRPDFLDRCQPAPDAQNASPYGLATQSVCRTDVNSHLISDGFRSFPSGHASTAFAGLTFLTLWLAGKFHIWQRSRGNAFSAWILFFPMIAATLIAVSRTMDYRHHATDVIAGGVLGFVIALSAYHNYYPPLWHYQSHKPWSPRTTAAHSYLQQDEGNGLQDPSGTADHDVERNPLQYGQGAGNGVDRAHVYSSDDDRAANHHFARKDRNADGVPYTDRSSSDEVEMSRPIAADVRS
jgi:diacylglycerol diphosphate phosphatase/phosphatidate phosphatase